MKIFPSFLPILKTKVFLALITLPLTGTISCSSLHGGGRKEVFRNSIFHRNSTHQKFLSSFVPSSLPNHPPSSPSSLSTQPVLTSPMDSTNIDLYLQSQSEYRYILAETWSLEGKQYKAIEEFKRALLYDPQSSLIRIRLALEYLKEELWQQAIQQIQIVLQKDPKSFKARFLLGHIYSSLSRQKEALKQYRILNQSHPYNIDVILAMASLFLQENDFEKTEKELLKGTLLPPNTKNAIFHWHLAHLYLFKFHQLKLKAEEQKKTDPSPQKKDFYHSYKTYKNKAKKALHQALLVNPQHIPSALLLSKMYDEEGSSDLSFQTLLSFQKKFGFHKKVSERLSEMYIEKEKYKEALKQLEALEDLDPYNLNYKLQAALIQFELKHYLEALDRFHEILRKEESDKIRFHVGVIYIKLNQPQEALLHLSHIPRISSYYPYAVIQSAYLYTALHQKDKAEEKVKKALKWVQNSPQLYIFYASLLDERKKTKKAIKILNQASLQFPQNVKLMFFLGMLYDKEGETEKCLATMKKVLLLDKEHLQAMNYLAYIYAENNTNLDLAETWARKVTHRFPNDGHYLDTLGRVLFKKGRLKEAIICLERALKHEPNQSVIAEHLAEAYSRYQLEKKALFMYKKALHLEKNEERKREILLKIKSLKHNYEKPKSITTSHHP